MSETNENTKNKETLILEAAEREFLDKGYERAKTVSIAKEAGVTHAMLHYYFRTKENLFNKIFQNKIEIIKTSILTIFANPELTILERIVKGTEKHFDFVAKNPKLPLFVLNEISSKNEWLYKAINEINSQSPNLILNFQNELDKEIKKGTINDIKVQDILIDIVSLNIFPFITLPILEKIIPLMYKSKEEFLEARRKENVEIIMKRIKKQ